MNRRRSVRLTPIYGWGWFDNSAAVDVPPPLELSAELLDEDEPPGGMVGQVDAADHPLDKLWLTLVRRGPGRGDYNVYVSEGRPPDWTPSTLDNWPMKVTGFAQLS